MHTDLAAHLAWSLRGGRAHCGVERAFGEVDPDAQGRLIDWFDHSLWQLLEHLRIAQRDLIDYSETPGHVSPPHPDGYWPQRPEPPDEGAYDAALARFLADREELCGLLGERDLLTSFPHAGGPDGEPHTWLRTATIALDHQAYHIGQAVAVRKALGCWAD
ncbi:DinB family protein [Alienimonas sp. DA493]|uniref:DinB family protein n=1 Tax=Alienimonas sp. DA493 TaxID=3373605 RepID=UPI003754B522